MSKKKSYMNKTNLIAEGFFSKLIKMVKDRKFLKTIEKDKKINKSLKNLNKSTNELEKHLNSMLKDAGLKPISLNKYELKDFV